PMTGMRFHPRSAWARSTPRSICGVPWSLFWCTMSISTARSFGDVWGVPVAAGAPFLWLVLMSPCFPERSARPWSSPPERRATPGGLRFGSARPGRASRTAGRRHRSGGGSTAWWAGPWSGLRRPSRRPRGWLVGGALVGGPGSAADGAHAPRGSVLERVDGDAYDRRVFMLAPLILRSGGVLAGISCTIDDNVGHGQLQSTPQANEIARLFVYEMCHCQEPQ